MLDLLKELRDIYGVTDVKAEFETEGTRLNELMCLKQLAERANLGLVVKIGGCEAVTDMLYARDIGISGLVAPMIESSFALKKYIEALIRYFPTDLRREIRFGINIETCQAVEKISEILNSEIVGFINFITLGRGDLTCSMGMKRDQVDDEEIYTIAEKVFTEAKEQKIETCIGGCISSGSINFIKRLFEKKLLDKFETRKVVYKITTDAEISNIGIDKALEFELLWLENKKRYYGEIFREDDTRIDTLKARINNYIP